MLNGKTIVMGVTGGIAVYKAVDVVSRLKKLGADIKVIMTESATEFVTPLTFETMSQNYVVSDMFGEIKSWDVEHISLAKSADLFLVAPATANIIGKVANGIADDMLSTTIMATKAKVVFAPAMNTNMYQNPLFKENVDKLKIMGYGFIAPASGRLACGDLGEGKLEDPEKIVEAVVDHFKKSEELSGKKVVVTAGPTLERLDPVRYISNNSSGKMGYRLAERARDRGAEVVLVSGPTHVEKPDGVKFVQVETTEEMFRAVEAEYGSDDILIKAAAPLDYRPSSYSENKIKKSEGKLKLEFERNVDIAKYFGEKKSQNQILIGFAAESENLIENAKRKLEQKNMDFIVANDITAEDSGFKSDRNKAFIISSDSTVEELPKMSKSELSDRILDKLIEILDRKAR